LAADPFNLAAVEEIFRVKGRPEERALPILVNSLDQAMLLGEGSAAEFFAAGGRVLAGSVDAGGGCFAPVAAESDGEIRRELRCGGRANELVARLIEEFDGPLTGTSANVSARHRAPTRSKCLRN